MKRFPWLLALILASPVLVAAMVLVGWWMLGFGMAGALTGRQGPTVAIIAEGQALASEEVATHVTAPLEAMCQGAAGVQHVRSWSQSGSAIVWVKFSPEAEVHHARALVAERVDRARELLPAGISPRLAQVSSGENKVVLIGLHSSGERSAM